MSSAMIHCNAVPAVSLPPANIAYSNRCLDSFSGQRELQVTFPLDPQEHVEQVLLVVAVAVAGAGGSVLLVFPDDGVRERVRLPPVLHHPPRHAAEPHGEARRRVEVRQGVPGEQLEPSLQEHQVLVPVLEPAPDDGVHRRVGGVRRQQRAQVHGGLRRRRRRRRRRHGAEQAADLLLADGAEGLDASRAEQLDGADLAELPPLVAVGREDDPLGARGEDEPRHPAHGSRGELDVARPHHLARRLRGGRHHDGELAEAEQHERAVAPRQVAHGVVRERARQVVQVPDHRQPPRRRRQPPALAAPARHPAEVDERHDGKESNDEQVGQNRRRRRRH
ncbi:Os06g0641866, partial [Oryza sativa Japonica Group]